MPDNSEQITDNRYESQIRTRMLIGDEACERLESSTVAVFGVGGVGGYAAEALARAGVGGIVIADYDSVARSNLNRQIIALESTIGLSKTEVMRRRIHDINPACKVHEHNTFVCADNIAEILAPEPGYIIDAVDTVSTKLALIEYAKRRGIPIISCMGAGNKLYLERLKFADISRTSVCPLARVMRYELKKRGIAGVEVLYSDEKPRKPLAIEESTGTRGACLHNSDVNEPGRRRSIPASISFVPSAAGLMLAGKVIRELAGVH